MRHNELMDKIKNAPVQPGCYLYRDSMGFVIYVGKAKLLRNRVRQYFQKQREDGNPKLENLVRVIADVEYQVTPTERDALMQEYRLIKQYKPWFNSQLVSAPRHWFLRIDQTSRRPSMTIAEQMADDGADHFGYFRDRFDAQNAVLLLNAAWHTPTCGKGSFDAPTRPCVQHEIGRCMAPCARSMDENAYRTAICEIIRLLSGDRPKLLTRLEAEMKRHAAQMEYEKAAAIKRQMEQLEGLGRRSRFLTRFPEKGDVLVFLRAYREEGYSLFLIRDGVAFARADLREAPDERTLQHMLDHPYQTDESWLSGCLIELYADKLFVPLPERACPSEQLRCLLDGYSRFANRQCAMPDAED